MNERFAPKNGWRGESSRRHWRLAPPTRYEDTRPRRVAEGIPGPAGDPEPGRRRHRVACAPDWNKKLMKRKLVMMVVILALAGVVHGTDWIQFPITSMGPNETQTFDVTGHMDQALAAGVQVVDITLAPVGGVTGTLSITAITTIGSTFELAEPGNWDDYSGPDWLIGMTGDWAASGVFGPLTAGSITLVSSADASGTWDILVSHAPTDGYSDVLGGVFGTVSDGQITITGGTPTVPEPTTLVLAGWGVLGTLVRRRRSVRSSLVPRTDIKEIR